MYAWGGLALIVTAVFVSGFLFQRARRTWDETNKLQLMYGSQAQDPESRTGLTGESRAAIEAELRAEYGARDAALISELGRIYDLEAEVRLITGFPPRPRGVQLDGEPLGGQGGGAPGEVVEIVQGDVDMLRPPHLIYGLSRPSADLMLQEIRMRTQSLTQLLRAMEYQELRISRLPSILPTRNHHWLSSRFGNRKDPFDKRMRFHGGLDIATFHGSPIQATAKGVVIKSGHGLYLGNYVRIDHENGYQTLYGHMSKRLVEVGDIVERGSVIGNVGSSGRSTSSHIHYEVYENGNRVNPMNYIGH